MSRCQSRLLVQKLLEHAKTEGTSLEDFYQYAARVCSKLVNKISIQKIRELWTGPSAVGEIPVSAKLEV